MRKNRDIPKFKLHDKEDKKLFVVEDLLSGRNSVDGDVDTIHTHTFHEIFWYKTLNGRARVDLDEYRVEPNTLIFVSANCPHAYIGEKEEHDNGIVIRFSDYFLREMIGDIDVHELFCGLDSCRCYYIPEELAAKLEIIEHEMRRECNDCSRWGHDEYLRNMLNIFLISVYREGRGEAASSNIQDIRSTRRFWQMKALLEQNYRRIHTVQAYADIMGISSRCLNECVRHNAGCTPLELINQRIILEAKKLICNTNMSIKEISSYLGFDDASYFVKFFKRHEGRIPSDIRRALANNI